MTFPIPQPFIYTIPLMLFFLVSGVSTKASAFNSDSADSVDTVKITLYDPGSPSAYGHHIAYEKNQYDEHQWSVDLSAEIQTTPWFEFMSQQTALFFFTEHQGIRAEHQLLTGSHSHPDLPYEIILESSYRLYYSAITLYFSEALETNSWEMVSDDPCTQDAHERNILHCTLSEESESDFNLESTVSLKRSPHSPAVKGKQRYALGIDQKTGRLSELPLMFEVSKGGHKPPEPSLQLKDLQNALSGLFPGHKAFMIKDLIESPLSQLKRSELDAPRMAGQHQNIVAFMFSTLSQSTQTQSTQTQDTQTQTQDTQTQGATAVTEASAVLPQTEQAPSPKLKDRKKDRAARTTFTTQQQNSLERHFSMNYRPNKQQKEAIAAELKLTPQVVKTWFQNRRAKKKRDQSSAVADSSTTAFLMFASASGSTFPATQVAPLYSEITPQNSEITPQSSVLYLVDQPVGLAGQPVSYLHTPTSGGTGVHPYNVITTPMGGFAPQPTPQTSSARPISEISVSASPTEEYFKNSGNE